VHVDLTFIGCDKKEYFREDADQFPLELLLTGVNIDPLRDYCVCDVKFCEIAALFESEDCDLVSFTHREVIEVCVNECRPFLCNDLISREDIVTLPSAPAVDSPFTLVARRIVDPVIEAVCDGIVLVSFSVHKDISYTEPSGAVREVKDAVVFTHSCHIERCDIVPTDVFVIDPVTSTDVSFQVFPVNGDPLRRRIVESEVVNVRLRPSSPIVSSSSALRCGDDCPCCSEVVDIVREFKNGITFASAATPEVSCKIEKVCGDLVVVRGTASVCVNIIEADQKTSRIILCAPFRCLIRSSGQQCPEIEDCTSCAVFSRLEGPLSESPATFARYHIRFIVQTCLAE
jgi:hypothetical protein